MPQTQELNIVVPGGVSLMLIILLIYFFAVLGLRWREAFSLVAASGGYSSLRCTGFSWRWLLFLLRGMWDLPGPGFEPVSPALAGRFFILRHQGNPGDVS